MTKTYLVNGIRFRIEVRHEAGYWSVYVNGQRLVDRESYEIAHQIAHHLAHPEEHDNSESAEVAESIRRWLKDGELAREGH